MQFFLHVLSQVLTGHHVAREDPHLHRVWENLHQLHVHSSPEETRPHEPHSSHTPKELLFGELASGTRPIGRPYKDICKHDLKALAINPPAHGRHKRLQARSEERSLHIPDQPEEKRAQRRVKAASVFCCTQCGIDWTALALDSTATADASQTCPSVTPSHDPSVSRRTY